MADKVDTDRCDRVAGITANAIHTAIYNLINRADDFSGLVPAVMIGAFMGVLDAMQCAALDEKNSDACIKDEALQYIELWLESKAMRRAMEEAQGVTVKH